MSVLDQLAHRQNRRDEVPNQELARRLAEAQDEHGIREIAGNLWNEAPNIRSDCIKVLYEVGRLAPELIAPYAGDLVRLLRSRNNRLVWGGMIALSTVAGIAPDAIDAHRAEIQRAMERGSVITVDAGNVDRYGFFCHKSKRKTPGYRQKRAWLESRFAEGMTIKIVQEQGDRQVGFIEYLPGENAWRAIQAPGYLVIHCLWVVGRGKGKGHGTRLADARAQKKRGVVMVSSDGAWLAGKELFEQNGFEQVAQAPPSFQLLVHRLDRSAAAPAFPTDWEARQARFGAGLTVLRTAQCPYLETRAEEMVQMAQEMGISGRVVDSRSAREVQETAPSPFGVCGMVLDGRLLSYRYLGRRELEKRLREHA